jgi:hypothetical protein
MRSAPTRKYGGQPDALAALARIALASASGWRPQETIYRSLQRVGSHSWISILRNSTTVCGGEHLQGEVAARGLAAAKLRYFRLLFEAILHDLGLAHASG